MSVEFQICLEPNYFLIKTNEKNNFGISFVLAQNCPEKVKNILAFECIACHKKKLPAAGRNLLSKEEI